MRSIVIIGALDDSVKLTDITSLGFIPSASQISPLILWIFVIAIDGLLVCAVPNLRDRKPGVAQSLHKLLSVLKNHDDSRKSDLAPTEIFIDVLKFHFDIRTEVTDCTHEQGFGKNLVFPKPTHRYLFVIGGATGKQNDTGFVFWKHWRIHQVEKSHNLFEWCIIDASLMKFVPLPGAEEIYPMIAIRYRAIDIEYESVS
jgi:hypothetical protein